MRKLALAFLLFSFSLSAVAAGYLKFDGIDGESKDAKHKEWIDILSVSHSVSPRDAASGLPTGKRQHKPVSVTKPVDKSSPMLAKLLNNGNVITNVKVKSDGHVTVLKSAQITSITKDARGNEVITFTPSVRAVKKATLKAAPAATKKGNAETTWKVEKGEK